MATIKCKMLEYWSAAVRPTMGVPDAVFVVEKAAVSSRNISRTGFFALGVVTWCCDKMDWINIGKHYSRLVADVRGADTNTNASTSALCGAWVLVLLVLI
jgi:hypothetical protein